MRVRTAVTRLWSGNVALRQRRRGRSWNWGETSQFPYIIMVQVHTPEAGNCLSTWNCSVPHRLARYKMQASAPRRLLSARSCRYAGTPLPTLMDASQHDSFVLHINLQDTISGQEHISWHPKLQERKELQNFQVRPVAILHLYHIQSRCRIHWTRKSAIDKASKNMSFFGILTPSERVGRDRENRNSLFLRNAGVGLRVRTS
jgi:hypothetical protein